MTVETHVDDALEQAQAEQEHITEKLAALDSFQTDLREIPTVETAHSQSAYITDGGGTTVSATLYDESTNPDYTREVRALFAEKVHPYSRKDTDNAESNLESIRAELGDEIALVLSPSTDGTFTTDVKNVIITKINQCQAELHVWSEPLIPR